MMFGVIMSLRNYRFFNDRISVITQFVPQMIFLIFLFFYLTLLMFIKWVTYSAQNERPWTIDCAPSILITFINMVLFKSVDWDRDDPKACSPFMFSGQAALQKLLVLCAVICIPWMLLAKPIHIMRSRKEALVSNAHRRTISTGREFDAFLCVCSINQSIINRLRMAMLRLDWTVMMEQCAQLPNKVATTRRKCPKSSFIRASTPLNMYWDQCRIPHHTCVFGLCHLLMPVSVT